jgi:hypothetical protein
MTNLEKLKTIVLAPWIYRGTELIGKPRKIGGNQFRHNMATLSILIDYKYVDPILLKASVIHDLLEEVPETNPSSLLNIDNDSKMVVDLVQEVTRQHYETKIDYLKRLIKSASNNAKILKCADRISNLTDLHLGIFKKAHIKKYLDETEKFVLPIAEEVNMDMFIELNDLINRRNEMLKVYT